MKLSKAVFISIFISSVSSSYAIELGGNKEFIKAFLPEQGFEEVGSQQHKRRPHSPPTPVQTSHQTLAAVQTLPALTTRQAQMLDPTWIIMMSNLNNWAMAGEDQFYRWQVSAVLQQIIDSYIAQGLDVLKLQDFLNEPTKYTYRILNPQDLSDQSYSTYSGPSIYVYFLGLLNADLTTICNGTGLKPPTMTAADTAFFTLYNGNTYFQQLVNNYKFNFDNDRSIVLKQYELNRKWVWDYFTPDEQASLTYATGWTPRTDVGTAEYFTDMLNTYLVDGFNNDPSSVPAPTSSQSVTIIPAIMAMAGNYPGGYSAFIKDLPSGKPFNASSIYLANYSTDPSTPVYGIDFNTVMALCGSAHIDMILPDLNISDLSSADRMFSAIAGIAKGGPGGLGMNSDKDYVINTVLPYLIMHYPVAATDPNLAMFKSMLKDKASAQGQPSAQALFQWCLTPLAIKSHYIGDPTISRPIYRAEDPPYNTNPFMNKNGYLPDYVGTDPTDTYAYTEYVYPMPGGDGPQEGRMVHGISAKTKTQKTYFSADYYTTFIRIDTLWNLPTGSALTTAAVVSALQDLSTSTSADFDPKFDISLLNLEKVTSTSLRSFKTGSLNLTADDLARLTFFLQDTQNNYNFFNKPTTPAHDHFEREYRY